MKVNNNILLIIALFLLTSCNVFKKSNKFKRDTTLNETTETITKRKGDTVTFTVPKIIYRDTTIYTVNRQGTTLRTVYNEQGQISQIDCFASMIEEITRSNRELIETIKDKEQEKKEEFNAQYFIYSIAFLAVIVLVGFIIISRKLKIF